MDRMICITGPTATGKTRLAVSLCLALGGEVVSCDSMQLYRGMDVGTAKVTPAETRGVPHHMIDVLDPAEPCSVGRYCELAEPVVRDILDRGRVAVLAGGTGLYMDALVLGRQFAPGPGTGRREELEALADREGIGAVQAMLREFDPEAAERLHPGNRRRIIRAVEVYLETGMTITEHDRLSRQAPARYEPVWIGLNYVNRSDLYERIDKRVDEMLANGLEAEIDRLLASGIPPEATSMQAIGYKQLLAFRRGETTREEAVEAVKRLSRNYAKRQLTWLRRNPDMHWIELPAEPDADAVLAEAERILAEAGFPGAEIFSSQSTDSDTFSPF